MKNRKHMKNYFEYLNKVFNENQNFMIVDFARAVENAIALKFPQCEILDYFFILNTASREAFLKVQPYFSL